MLSWPRVPDDAELLTAWRSGDQAAGRRLAERYFDPIYRFFRNKAGSDIDDLVQGTFLRCAQSKDAIRNQASFRAYLFRIARNVLADHYGSRRREHASLDTQRLSVTSMGVTPTRMLAQREEQRLLLEALRSIPLDEQVLLELVYWERLTGRELAAVLGVPEGTARTRLRSARQSLEAQLHRLARTPDQLQSTIGNLERWSASIRELLADDRG